MLPPLPSLRLAPAHDWAPVAVRPLPAPASPAPALDIPHLLRIGARWTLLGVALGLFLALTGPLPFGGRALTVMSGSMAPAIETGDVVVALRISPSEARVGDVVTFRDPEKGNRLITHRVRRVAVSGGVARFVTKGDSSNAVERWTVPVDGSLGRVAYRLPKLGYALFWLQTPYARIALVVIPTMLLGLFAIIAIWRPRPEQ